MKKIYIIIIIIVICLLIAFIYKLDNKTNNEKNKLSSYNFIKDTISNEKDWDEKSVIEQFMGFEYNNNHYSSTDMEMNVDYIKAQIETTSIIGCENFEYMHEKQITLYAIKDISTKDAVAVKFEDDENYYVYVNSTKDDTSHEESEIIKYDKKTNTTTPVEISNTNGDSFSPGFDPTK